MEKRNRRLSALIDRLAAGVITVAGAAVILAMIAMLVLIAREAVPLFIPAGQAEIASTPLPAGVDAERVAAIGVEADLHGRQRAAALLLRDGRGGIAVSRDGSPGAFSLARLPGAPSETASIRAVETHGGAFSVLWDDGTLSRIAMDMAFAGDDGGNAAAFRRVVDVKLDPAAGVPLFAMLRGGESAYRSVAVYPDGTVREKSLMPGKGLSARKKNVRAERSVASGLPGRVLSAALDESGATLYLGDDNGDIACVAFPGDPKEKPAVEVTPAFRDRRAVTALAFLAGNYAVAVGDAGGGASVWFPRREGGAFRFRRSAEWPAAGRPVEKIVASGRDRGFLVFEREGGMRWLYSTNGRKLADVPVLSPTILDAALNERADTLLTLRSDSTLVFHRLSGSFPEAGWKAFFGRILYEGYEKPAFVWQSTGSDSSEPKLSLAPLVWGSVKAAVYALIFAAPISLAAAVYLSQFARPAWRARLKPAVEMLAAVPSVVIGFVAALWLAPFLERHLHFLARHWQYDQRNSLVIAVAMGFAVIPTIFSLAEDAVSAVPPALSAASLALGASKWQTVCRVVIPTASPGIFTAAMLGFGRAVGETMIVLMAAGNTPILSLSPFNGMRTLSANIAVEMPEAPVGGTLYRTLFLCALILFLLTLVINSAAEMFRHRLRRRYGRL